MKGKIKTLRTVYVLIDHRLGYEEITVNTHPNLKLVSENCGLSQNELYYHFGRKGNTEMKGAYWDVYKRTI